MECISKRSSGSDYEDAPRFRPIPWGRRSPPPPPLPPKPSAPPCANRYPPQVPYFHPPAEYFPPPPQFSQPERQTCLQHNQFYPVENNWYQRASLHSSDVRISRENVQMIPAYALNEEFISSMQPSGCEAYVLREEQCSIMKPPASPVAAPRHRRSSLPRNSFVPISSSPMVVCFQTPNAESRGYEDQRRRKSLTPNSEAVDDKLRRLESDKDSLQLQVSVLSEQIAAQSEKINDLERLLNEKKNLLTNAEELLQREMLTRSSLETQKLELMSTISDSRLRQAALERENLELRGGLSNGVRGLPNSRTSPSPCPSPAPTTNREGSTPRTPPASYRRLVNPEQSPHSYSSLPRGASLASPGGRPSPLAPMHSTPVDTAVVVRFGKPNQQHCMVVARGRGHSVPNLAEKDTVIGTGSPILGKMGGTGKGWGGLWRGGSGGTLEDVEGMGRGEPFQRGGVRATAAPRLQTTHIDRWSSTPVKEWDADITCEWLESMGLDCYNADAKKWLTNSAGNKGIIATATPQQLEKELNIKNPLHKKKIVLALMDMTVSPVTDTLLHAAGRLDCAWALRWLEDLGLPQYREAWASAAADGRVLHLLCQEDLVQLRVTSQMHALSIKRGIQVLRETNFSPDTMIRRAGVPEGATGDSEERPAQLEWGHVSRWSSHRVMEWLRAVDLAEYAPNLRGAGVHGGLMYYEVRFTGELLATLLNIPPSKTLLRRHLNTRFNQLIGKEVIQEKREAEQTLGYQPLTLSSKVKIVKKGQFTLKRKKNKGESEYNDLVCPIVDQASDDEDGSLRRRGGCLSAN